jgi:uncharacterized membrane protein YuzA (DUF378 family)
MRGMSILSKIGLLAAAVGAANWLAVGVWHYNFIAAIFGSGTQSATGGVRIIYIVFGVGAVLCLPLLAAALGSAPSGRRATAEEEPVGQARAEAVTPRQAAETTEGQQLVDYQEFKEFQAWRAAKHAQEASPEAGREEQRAE